MLTRDFVSTVYIVKDSKILLVFHKKLNMWLPPGGHVDENEVPCDTAKREVLEETGFEVNLIGEEKPLGKGVKKLIHPKVLQLEDIEEGHQHINIIYYGTVNNGTLKLNEEEHSDIKWFSLDDLEDKYVPENVRIYGRKAMEELNKI